MNARGRRKKRRGEHYHSLLSRLPSRHRTLIAILCFVAALILFVFWQVRQSDKLAELIAAALIEHLLFGD